MVMLNECKMLLFHRPVPAKIPKRRSRAGCVHCKEKKKKCNEQRPQCDRCAERGLTCQYEPVKPRKRRRTVSAMEQESRRAASTTSDPGPPPSARSLGDPPRSAKWADFPPWSASAIPHDLARDLLAESEYRPDSAPLPGSHGAPAGSWEEVWESYGSPNLSDVHSMHSVFGSPVTSSAGGEHPVLDSIDPFPLLEQPPSSLDCEIAHPIPGAGLGIDCTTPDFPLPPPTPGIAGPGVVGVGIPALPTPEMSQSPVLPGLVPTVGRTTGGTGTGSPYSELYLASTPQAGTEPVTTPTLTSSRAMLVEYFCDTLVRVFTFHETSSQNAFRQFILPLGRRCPAVMNAIYAVSSAHMERAGIEVEERSLDFHSRTIYGLTRLLENPKTGRDEALAVIMLLVYEEIIRNGSTHVVCSHLRGAMSVMRARRSGHSPTSAFLEKTFRYFDVLCALSLGTAPMGGNSPQEASSGAVDPVYGLTGDLWPMMHRVATLASQQAQHQQTPSTPMSPSVDSATTLELAITQWTPPTSPSSADVSPADTAQTTTCHAEAYKHALLAFLHREVLHSSSPDQIQIHAKQALQACLRVVIFSAGAPLPPGLLWPLQTAALSAMEDVDRDVARTVFAHLEAARGVHNVSLARDVVGRCWDQCDAGQRDVILA